MAGVIAPNTSPRFSPPILKPDSFSWMLCKPSGVVSCPNTCFTVSPMPAIFPVNLSKTASPPSPNTVPTMLRMSSKWSPNSETAATIVPMPVMTGPNVPSSDMKPPPSFAATGPTVVPSTFSPAPPTFKAPFTVLKAPPPILDAAPATLLPTPRTVEPTLDWLTVCHALDSPFPMTVFPAPRKFFTPPAIPPRSRPFGPATPPVLAINRPTGLPLPNPTRAFFRPPSDCPTLETYLPEPEFFSTPSRPPFVLASSTSFTKPVFPFLVPLRRPLKFFSVAQMPTPAPSNVCPIFPRRVVGCCAPAPAI